MFCKNCGKQLNPNANFCAGCGEKLSYDNGGMVENKNHSHEKGLVSFIKNLFRGRLGRLDYFLFVFLTAIAAGIISSVLLAAVSTFESDGMTNAMAVISVIIYLCIALPLILSGHIRRLHDMQMSGFWVLSFIIPLVGGIFIIVLLFARGTIGINKYGVISTNKNFFKRIFNLN